MIKNKRVGVISLGCDKNRVDTEKMLALVKKIHTVTNDLENAEIVIINTCAFLESSRKEAIEEILAVNALKELGALEKIIVTGCLPQLAPLELYEELVEVDGFLGISDYQKINEVITRIYNGERVLEVGKPKNECLEDRTLTTDGHAYLKIADGCKNCCTYCLIPKIRGGFRSIPVASLIKETKLLGNVKELILVAQDLTSYGQDLTPKTNLVSLIRELSALDKVEKIRLLYCYPEGITDELIAEIKTNPKVIKYLDIPFQHANDLVLKKMNRKGTGESYLKLIEKLRKEISGIAIRSTFITGFPYEDESAFCDLISFIEKAKLDNAGFFKYSREKGTMAYNMPITVSGAEKTKRHKKLYSLQKKISRANLRAKVGKVLEVLCEGFDENRLVYYGRAYFNAPDIDGKVYFFASREVEFNTYLKVKIIKAEDYDLYGDLI
jgi:ribosomal protein S12 methylthiotransferase